MGNATPAEWTDPDGSIGIDPSAYAMMTGTTAVVVVRWTGGADVAACLRRLAAIGDFEGCLAGEAQRLERDPGLPPAGWEHHWLLGPSEVYERRGDSIAASTCGDAAIICHAADTALTEDTILSWEWKVDQLPSAHAENTLATHDYLSIAVEFDDGQDLTYYWSAALDVGTSYRCPLPHWSERETHLVVRKGLDRLGRWTPESRHVLADHRAAIGGPTPARVVRVWLIAVSCMQRRPGRCQYRNIVLGDKQACLRLW